MERKRFHTHTHTHVSIALSLENGTRNTTKINQKTGQRTLERCKSIESLCTRNNNNNARGG